MKTSSYVSRATSVLGLSALVVFAGCTNAPLRRSTLALETQDPAVVHEIDLPGYEAPTVLQSVMPKHPWDYRRLGIAGAVEVIVDLDATGRVIDAQVANSTDPAFDDAALAAVKQWTFRPATRDGVAIPSRAGIPIKFELDD